ncbi:MAG TPA: hypothetical protein VH415_15040 [Nitrososphaeraceae archaeon]|jgi:hypothetical protein
MNEKNMKALLDRIVLLSDTIESLAKPNCTQAELITYSNAKKVFVSLMEMPVDPQDSLEVYEFNVRKHSFELVEN